MGCLAAPKQNPVHLAEVSLKYYTFSMLYRCSMMFQMQSVILLAARMYMNPVAAIDMVI